MSNTISREERAELFMAKHHLNIAYRYLNKINPDNLSEETLHIMAKKLLDAAKDHLHQWETINH